MLFIFSHPKKKQLFFKVAFVVSWYSCIIAYLYISNILSASHFSELSMGKGGGKLILSTISNISRFMKSSVQFFNSVVCMYSMRETKVCREQLVT